MTPRPYTPVERNRAVEAGRERILTAARDILDLDDLAAFSLEAVAKRAGVTRMTVYNQFGSKAGLLEQLLDLIIERGAFAEMPVVFREADNGKAFDAFVAILGRFYTENRTVLASMSAAAGTDADLVAALRSRNERRRKVIEGLVQRLGASAQRVIPDRELPNAVDVLLNYNTFIAIAGPDRTPNDVVPLMQRMLRRLLGLRAARPRQSRSKQRR